MRDMRGITVFGTPIRGVPLISQATARMVWVDAAVDGYLYTASWATPNLSAVQNVRAIYTRVGVHIMFFCPPNDAEIYSHHLQLRRFVSVYDK